MNRLEWTYPEKTGASILPALAELRERPLTLPRQPVGARSENATSMEL
jgi:hypothetical protein